jgi:DNA-binding MarR family transcriptional regulator
MQDDLRSVENRILKTLASVEKPISGKVLMELLDTRSPTSVGINLERLENKGFVAPRRPYQRQAIVLTETGKAAAAALIAAAALAARKEAA